MILLGRIISQKDLKERRIVMEVFFVTELGSDRFFVTQDGRRIILSTGQGKRVVARVFPNEKAASVAFNDLLKMRNTWKKSGYFLVREIDKILSQQ